MMLSSFATLDVCTSDQLPEIEIISILSESLPRYKLRANSITDFSSYQYQDWGVQPPPLVQARDLQLSNEQINEVFKYFLICGERVSQMTKVYDDIEAVTHLLEEKEKDLELAARIGQTLLEQNKHLVIKCEQLELELTTYQEQTAQLRHDLTHKEQLLQLLTTEEQVDGSQPSPSKEICTSKYVDLVQKKLSSLKEDNTLLRSEINNLSEQTEQIEKHEQRLTSECIQQLNEAQQRLRELQTEVDQKGIDLIKCQEECSSVIRQLVSGQQKMKELTIENLDMKETIKTSNEIQQELTSELFELREKYKECKDLLDCTKHEVMQLKLKSSPRVATHRYYTGPCYIPPEGSLAAELESLNSGDKDINRKTNSKVLETAHYVRKLSSKPPSLTSSMTSNSGRTRKPTAKNLLMSLPIPGSPITRPSANPMSSSLTNSSPFNKSLTQSSGPSSQFYDEIERHRQNLGRPGIPGSKDLDAALKRLTLRRQNEESERDYRERHLSEMSQPSTIPVESQQQQMEWSGPSTPTVRSPSPESELSGYGSASSFGYRLPEKLQIVKPIEGSATLHHWQRLATPHLAGLFEERDGVQIKHGQPLSDMESDTYSLLDVEEEVVPVRPSGRTLFTNTVTDARVMHPSMTSFGYQSPATVSSGMPSLTVMASSGNTRYGSGIISRLDSSHSSGLTSLLDDLHSTPSKPSLSAASVVTSSQLSASVVTPSQLSTSVVTSQSVVTKPRMSANPLSTKGKQQSDASHNPTSNHSSQDCPPISRPLSSFTNFSPQTFTTPTKAGSMVSSYASNTSYKSTMKVSPSTAQPIKPKQSFGILSSFYEYMAPSPATTTTQSGISSIISDTVIGDSKASRSAYSRTWQRPWL